MFHSPNIIIISINKNELLRHPRSALFRAGGALPNGARHQVGGRSGGRRALRNHRGHVGQARM